MQLTGPSGQAMGVDDGGRGEVIATYLGEIEYESGKTGYAYSYASTYSATANDAIFGLQNPTNSGKVFCATQAILGVVTAGSLRLSFATGTPAAGAVTAASLHAGVEPTQPGNVHGGIAVTGLTEAAKIAYVVMAANTTYPPIDLRGVILEEGKVLAAYTAVSSVVYVTVMGYWKER